MAPAKTPPEIVSRLEQASLDILRRPGMDEKLLQQGFAVQAKDGKAHMARVAREVPMFREIIAQSGIKQM
jgi:tripartite-type tricarboxylate transporter receptor subunit TctC